MLRKNVHKQIGSEEVTKVFKRHPVGLIPLYTFILISAFVLFTTVSYLRDPNLSFGELPEDALQIIIVLGVILLITFLVAGRYVYWSNDLVVTNEKVIQVLRPDLFHRDIAQINLGKIQDVAVRQKGFLQMSFNYGTIVIETAGEVASYSFTYARKPKEVASAIVKAHDDYLERHGHQKQDILGAP